MKPAIVVQFLSQVHLFVTPWTVALQAPLSIGFSRQEYWSVLPFLSLGSGIKPVSSALAGRFFTTEPPGKPSETRRLFLISKRNVKVEDIARVVKLHGRVTGQT